MRPRWGESREPSPSYSGLRDYAGCSSFTLVQSAAGGSKELRANR